MIDTQHTLEFVRECLGPKAKILEVGSEGPRLAMELMDAGYDVTTLDPSPEKVEGARRRGVKAEVGDILQYESSERFDAILFTGSFPQAVALDPLLNKVKSLLEQRGRMLVEHARFEQMDEKTAEWFYELRDLFGCLVGTSSPQTSSPFLERWRNETGGEPPKERETLLRAMERRFGNPHVTTAPYLYRYFVPLLQDFPHAAPALHRVFEWEKRLIEKAQIQPMGLRISAKMYFSYLR